MRLSVKFFAGCKDAVGRPVVEVDMPDGTTVGGVLDRLIREYPGLERYRRSLRVAVNTEYASPETQVNDGDDLACIPPVSGGG